MNLLTYVLIGFLILEITNVITLYFFPETKFANAVGVFKAWEKSKEDPEIHNFVKYLVNWVAGTKLIFILVLIIVLIFSDQKTIISTGIAIVISIATFYWRLFPMIRAMDHNGEITPKNYSFILGWMIAGIILIIITAIIVLVLV